MKSKYLLSKQDGAIVIEERGELDPGTFSSLSEKKMDIEDFDEAVKIGTAAVVEVFRDNNIFPPSSYANQIAEAIIEMLKDGAEPEKELLFNDLDFLVKGERPIIVAPDVESEAAEIDIIDDMLADDVDEEAAFIEDDFSSLEDPESGSLKVADDDIGDMDIDV
ncbi:hypothetical protein [Desulforegula conservatrix]|uniref:hypothetical protein n=1 Tax=Desulforegula conservatrix TaxID=153026 RepID=UPI000427BC1B|nr:hypothetical protein [Desulforegula conservatrix]